MAKPPTVRPSAFAKAADILLTAGPAFSYSPVDDVISHGATVFQHVDGRVVCWAGAGQLAATQVTDVGDVLRFVHVNIAAQDPCSPPATLGGNGKELEELLMNEAKRMEKDGILTMGRYGTMVSMVDDAWLPVPSLPDFDGVRGSGRQFIIEAKVCSQPSFRIQSDKIKHKQVKHMLKRSRFGVDCHVLIHFNARTGVTFYDPPFTVAMPIRCGDFGWHRTWEQFAECKVKDQEFPSLTRAIAMELGTPVKWHIPPRANKPRPDLLGLVGEL
jgi:hypothetical protein